ncbi:MAG TPA: hypothetical protein VM934_10930 [Pyrinomonadaceae bacterium]|nr:hypothetical protein [Pyrinomonadaceae bacterium]
MKNRARALLVWLLLSSLLFANIPFLALDAAAQKILPAAQHDRAVRLLSHYVVGSDDVCDRLLQQIGFYPPVAEADWKMFPVIRKIETAYRMAEEAVPGGGGEQALARLSQSLAQLYAPVRTNPLLKALVSHKVRTNTIAFRPAANYPQAALPKKVTDAIATIAAYCSRGPMGSPQAVMVRYFGLSQDEAYELLTRSDNHAEAFAIAYARTPEAERLTRLGALAKDLAPHYESIRYDKNLLALGLFTKDAPPTGSVAGGGSGAGVGAIARGEYSLFDLEAPAKRKSRGKRAATVAAPPVIASEALPTDMDDIVSPKQDGGSFALPQPEPATLDPDIYKTYPTGTPSLPDRSLDRFPVYVPPPPQIGLGSRSPNSSLGNKPLPPFQDVIRGKARSSSRAGEQRGAPVSPTWKFPAPEVTNLPAPPSSSGVGRGSATTAPAPRSSGQVRPIRVQPRQSPAPRNSPAPRAKTAAETQCRDN